MLERQEEERQEAMRRAIIEQERQRLLHEHAAKLLGYFQRSVQVVLLLSRALSSILRVFCMMKKISLILEKISKMPTRVAELTFLMMKGGEHV